MRSSDWSSYVCSSDLRFGLPSIAAFFSGAWVLVWLSGVPPIYSYEAFGRSWAVLPVKLVVGSLLLVFGALEVFPRFSELSFGPKLKIGRASCRERVGQYV